MASEEMVALVAGELRAARDANELRPLGELQSATGLGNGDVVECLEELREAGRAVEETPGEWREAYEDEREPGEEPEPEAVAGSGDETAAHAFVERSTAAAREAGRTAREDERRVELTAAVVTALDQAALGALVEAGVADAAQAQVPFVFVVTP